MARTEDNPIAPTVPATRPVGSLRIVLLGFVVRGPLGGFANLYLHYLLGLRGLGHEVYFLEESDDYPSCYDPSRQVTDHDPHYGLAFARRLFANHGFGECWAYYDAHTSTWYGPCAGRVPELCATADVLLNVGGVNPIRPWLGQVPVRVLIDLDPVFTQIRHLTDPAWRARATLHNCFFTLAENWGVTGSEIPDDGFAWEPTRQPLVRDLIPIASEPPWSNFTTVMQWNSYAAVEFRGRRFGQKSDSFAPYLSLPSRTASRLELALGSASAPREVLRRHGWLVRDPVEVSLDERRYWEYIRQSRGEFSVAKQGYVAARTGWFSERSLAYLASGRPVVIQDTGFSDWLPTGEGVLAFSELEEAVAQLEAAEHNYARHCRVARELAVEFFDSTVVLRSLIERAMNSAYPAASRTTRDRGTHL
jgi:hypothetical protein